MNEPIFRGVATALVTPFQDGHIDFDALDRLLELQLSAGITEIVLCGTSGEASTLREEEKIALWTHAVHTLRGRARMIAGTGTNDTRTAVALSQAAERCGADALLVVTPYYNKCSQAGLLLHYQTVADAVSLPVIAYNVPSRTGVDLLPETCAQLARHPRIAGIKEASGKISRVTELRQRCGDAFAIWSGNDDQITPMMSLGADGVISVLSNVRPKGTKALTDACLRGDYLTAARLQRQYAPLIRALFSDVNPIPVKAALCALGLCGEEVRLPLCPLASDQRVTLHAALLTCAETAE